ncbi:MAG TPA: TlpA disulfide reductase family protein [Candidatus Polarisedimenticolia bacterium]|nr:TlpA disulfide reductase family protein [Candidatus Polarisedimenticolia bacterium]
MVLELSDLEGRPSSLASYRGKAVLLNFWATWCVPCREEMPALRRIQARYAARGLSVVAASADEPARREEVRRFAHRHLRDLTVWTGATTRHMERLGLGEALPATALIDPEGRIAVRFIGPFDAALLESWVEWLLDGQAGLPPGSSRITAPSFSEEGPADRRHAHSHAGGHGEEEEHHHGTVGMEGASLVPS